MKKMLIYSTMILGTSALVGFQGASAAEIQDQNGETQTTIKVKDGIDDPDQKGLLLQSVPSKYAFETTISPSEYKLGANLSQDIVVFNDKIDRDWSVKAHVDNNEITISKGKTLPINSFKINNVEIAETGASGIVAKAQDIKSADNNTGSIRNQVLSVNINFLDAESKIKVGDELTAKVMYQLYNTKNAK